MKKLHAAMSWPKAVMRTPDNYCYNVQKGTELVINDNIKIFSFLVLIFLPNIGNSQADNQKCPMPELNIEIKIAYNQLLQNPGNIKYDSIFVNALEKSFYRYNCNRGYDPHPVPALWLCDNCGTWIDHLSKMESMVAKRLFGSDLFRSVLDGHWAEFYMQMSKETEYNLNNPDKLIEYNFGIFPSFNEDNYRREVEGTDVICTNISIAASSHLKNAGKFNYLPQNMIDTDLSTAWVEGKEDRGVGETINLIFKDDVIINGLLLKNGYAKDDKTWEENSRIKTIIILINNKEKYKLHLMDIIGFQFALFSATEFKKNESIEIKIVDIYKGTKYKDTAITELYPLIQF